MRLGRLDADCQSFTASNLPKSQSIQKLPMVWGCTTSRDILSKPHTPSGSFKPRSRLSSIGFTRLGNLPPATLLPAVLWTVSSCKPDRAGYSLTSCRPVNVCVATPHAVDTPSSAQWRNYGFADCAAILDVTSAAFPTGLRQDPAVDLPVKDFKPKSDEDKRLQDLCKYLLYIGLTFRWQA